MKNLLLTEVRLKNKVRSILFCTLLIGSSFEIFFGFEGKREF